MLRWIALSNLRPYVLRMIPLDNEMHFCRNKRHIHNHSSCRIFLAQTNHFISIFMFSNSSSGDEQHYTQRQEVRRTVESCIWTTDFTNSFCWAKRVSRGVFLFSYQSRVISFGRLTLTNTSSNTFCFDGSSFVTTFENIVHSTTTNLTCVGMSFFKS